jgi:hypothetical protein
VTNAQSPVAGKPFRKSLIQLCQFPRPAECLTTWQPVPLVVGGQQSLYLLPSLWRDDRLLLPLMRFSSMGDPAVIGLLSLPSLLQAEE